MTTQSSCDRMSASKFPNTALGGHFSATSSPIPSKHRNHKNQGVFQFRNSHKNSQESWCSEGSDPEDEREGIERVASSGDEEETDRSDRSAASSNRWVHFVEISN